MGKVWEYFGILKYYETNLEQNIQPITWTRNPKNTGIEHLEKKSPKSEMQEQRTNSTVSLHNSAKTIELKAVSSSSKIKKNCFSHQLYCWLFYEPKQNCHENRKMC